MPMRHLVVAICVFVCSCTPDPFEAGAEALEAKKYEEALAKWRPLAQQGHTKAQNALGVMYSDGLGVPQDYKEAASWYRKAAEQGFSRAQANLGDMYAMSRGVPRDYKEAASWYRKAAEQGLAYGQYMLGVMYSNGDGLSKDFKEAASWYRKAAEQGHADARFELGIMYWNGEGVPQDYKEAASWYRKAAEQGNARAQNNLGVMYLSGKGVPQDDVLAYMLYNLAAAGGNKLGADNRAFLTRKLSREQIEEAQMLSSKWKTGTALPNESKTGQITKADKKASESKVAATALRGDCSPPAGKTLRYSDKCMNGDCIRTFENGCQKRFQAPYCYDALQGRWTWKPDGC